MVGRVGGDGVEVGDDVDRGVLGTTPIGGGAASANQLSPKVYGMTSGGTSPSIRSMRKNGAPSNDPVGSRWWTRGTGTSVSSATLRMTSN